MSRTTIVMVLAVILSVVSIGSVALVAKVALDATQANAEETAGEGIDIIEIDLTRFRIVGSAEPWPDIVWINPPELEAELLELERRITTLEALVDVHHNDEFTFNCEPPECIIMDGLPWHVTP